MRTFKVFCCNTAQITTYSMHPHTKILLAVSTFASLAFPTTASTQNNERLVELNCLNFKISDSWTAQVFHIVDQLSEWSQYTHHQYIRWAKKKMQLNKDDSAMLHQHALLRQAHEISDDFDKSFLVNAPIEKAIAAAIVEKRLTEEEGIKEQSVLLYFSKRLSALQDTAVRQVTGFYKNLDAATMTMTSFIKKICDFTATKEKLTVPVFIVANPENGNGGGEANGGRLVIELQDSSYTWPVLIHESFHFLLRPYMEQVKAMSDSAQVDWQVINEGLAYAMAGLLEDVDRLPNALVVNIARGKGLPDWYTQFYMAGLVFRPMLRIALEKGETITGFLPWAIRRWKQVNGR